MKKFYFAVFALFFVLWVQTGHTQVFTSGFETWTAGKPDGWFGLKTSIATSAVIKDSVNVHTGMYACQLQNTTTTHKRFTTGAVPIVAGKTYEIKFWVRGHGEIRTGCYKGAGSSGSAYYTYNPYIIVNSSSWSEQTQTITVDTTSALAEFIISVRSTVADLDHLQIDDVSIDSIGGGPVPTVSIYDIQYTTDTSGDSPYLNQVVNTGGLVTAYISGSPKGYFIQSGFGPWNGIFVLDTNTVAEGDSVTITGLVTEYYKLTEIKSLSEFVKVSSGNPIYQPDTIPPVLVNTEPYESVFLCLYNVTCSDTAIGFGQWEVTDGNDNCLIDDVMYHYVATPGVHYIIKGIGYYSFSEHKALPRKPSDVSVFSGIAEISDDGIAVWPNPASEELNILSGKDADLVVITSIQGQTIARLVPEAGKVLRFNSGNLSQGNYIVSIFAQGRPIAKRIIVKY